MQTGKVFFDMVLSLDGLMAPEGMDPAHMNDPEYKQWSNKWMGLMHWVFQQKLFRENLKIGEGGETGQEATSWCTTEVLLWLVAPSWVSLFQRF